MEKRKISKSGWNWYSFFFNIIWYFKYGIMDKAIIMLVLVVCSLGVGILPISIYCGLKGNYDRYKQNMKKITF